MLPAAIAYLAGIDHYLIVPIGLGDILRGINWDSLHAYIVPIWSVMSLSLPTRPVLLKVSARLGFRPVRTGAGLVMPDHPIVAPDPILI